MAETKDVAEKISAEERRSREDAVNFSRASLRLEGFKVSELAESLAQRYIKGEAEISDMLKALDDRYRKCL